MSSEIQRELAQREQGPASVAELLTGALPDASSRSRAGATARAMMVWCQVNGDVERAHTMGVSVVAPRGAARDPQLVVYVDSGSWVTDFNANREIYLARLDAAGLRFSEVSFRRSKYGRVSRETQGARRPPDPRPLPPLSAEEERRVETLCSALPEPLRESASRAMRVSLQSQMTENS